MVVRSARDQAYIDGLWTGRVEAVAVTYLATSLWKEWSSQEEEEQDREWTVDFKEELKETRALLRELKDEATQDPLVLQVLNLERPADGLYLGESAEDDAGDQDVSTKLTFHPDGTVTGEGYDSVDGFYTIKEGRWGAKKVGWVEQYAEGFKVALRGQVRPDGTIYSLWASDRGVGGSATLKPPA